MPKLSLQGRTTGAVGTNTVNVDNLPLYWPSDPTKIIHSHQLIGQNPSTPIIGASGGWVNNSTIIFQACTDKTTTTLPESETNPYGHCKLYTYNVDTGVASVLRVTTSLWSTDLGMSWPCSTCNDPAHDYVSDWNTGDAENDAPGANGGGAGGGVWVANLGDVYYDSLGRISNKVATVGPLGVDPYTGTVLVVSNVDGKGMGLGYLTTTDTVPGNIKFEDTHIIAEGGQLGPSFGMISNNVVFYQDQTGGWQSYHIITGQRQTMPWELFGKIHIAANDGYTVLAFHNPTSKMVVFNWGDAYGWNIDTKNLTQDDQKFWPQVRVLPSGKIIVAASITQGEAPGHTVVYPIDTSAPKMNLYGTTTASFYTSAQVTSTVPTNTGRIVTGTDIITIGTQVKLISSDSWVGSGLGHYLRAAYQFGVTAIVCQTGSCGSNLMVKDSRDNIWCASEVAHGIHCVAIRPATGTTSEAPLWEVTWVRGAVGNYGAGGSYARIILDDELVPTGAQTETAAALGSQGMLDLDENGNPIITDDNRYGWYGYVKIGLATTRGTWTIGQDVAGGIDRLIAWNEEEQQAYAVWNGYTPVQSRLALEYDTKGNARPVVAPALRETAIRLNEFVPITQADYLAGEVPILSDSQLRDPDIPILPFPPVEVVAPTPSVLPVAASVPVPSTLTRDTRVFRVYQTIPPTADVLEALSSANTSGETYTEPTSESLADADGVLSILGPVVDTTTGGNRFQIPAEWDNSATNEPQMY